MNWHGLVFAVYIWFSYRQPCSKTLGNTLCERLTSQNHMHFSSTRIWMFLYCTLFYTNLRPSFFTKPGVRSPKPHCFEISLPGDLRSRREWTCMAWCAHGLTLFAKSVPFLKYVVLSLLFLVHLNVKRIPHYNFNRSSLKLCFYLVYTPIDINGVLMISNFTECFLKEVFSVTILIRYV